MVEPVRVCQFVADNGAFPPDTDSAYPPAPTARGSSKRLMDSERARSYDGLAEAVSVEATVGNAHSPGAFCPEERLYRMYGPPSLPVGRCNR